MLRAAILERVRPAGTEGTREKRAKGGHDRQVPVSLLSVTGLPEIRDLVRTASMRTPPLFGRLRCWYHVDRLGQAMQRKLSGLDGQAGGGLLISSQDPAMTVSQATDRLWADPQRGAYRLERDWQDPDGPPRISAHVSDGITEWMPTYSGAFHAGPLIPDAFPARNLLDPSWLVRYHWATPLPDSQNDRDVLVVQARLTTPLAAFPAERANADAPVVLRQRPPDAVAVVIDAEYGFLHRMTGLIDQQPFVVEELLDIVLNPPLDESMFQVASPRS